MSLFNKHDLPVARAVGALANTNPFLEKRVKLEKRILGDSFARKASVWIADPSLGNDPNLTAIRNLSEGLLTEARKKLAGNSPAPFSDDEIAIYEDLARYVIYYKYEESFYRAISDRRSGSSAFPRYGSFKADVEHFLQLPSLRGRVNIDPAHLYAIAFQTRRAFHFTFRRILGSSMAAAGLRANVWRSILTTNAQHHSRHMFNRMQDVATLVVGPSGTGKELVASAIGLSRYIPFDPLTESFKEDFRDGFRPVNLSALAPTLIESEIFGYCKGAFTGAVTDRTGILDAPSPWHTVFLDEIAEVSKDVQVKLLRVLQSREFHRLGDRVPRMFNGKIMAATNRCLATEIEAGHFRSDLYYRLCSDTISTPSLAEQIDGDPDELRSLISLICTKALGTEAEKETADRVHAWTVKNLGENYGWPGNMRELEQCVLSFAVRGEYTPLAQASARKGGKGLVGELMECDLSLEELISAYCTVAYKKSGEYLEAARLLGVDRRTLKSKVDPDLLNRMRIK